MPETFTDECIACGHRYDRSEHDECPGCANESLTEYPTTEPEP